MTLFSPSRRLVLGWGVAGLVAPLAGCTSLDLFGGREKAKIGTTSASKPYKPVDPAAAMAALNAYRAANGIRPLSLNATLGRVAQAYAEHMAERGEMNHALEPWGPIDRRLKTAGYAYATAGENIGEGYRDFAEVFEGWKRSPSHDRGMKDADMTEMGIASAYNAGAPYQVYWCLVFAKPRGGTSGFTGPSASVGAGPFSMRW